MYASRFSPSPHIPARILPRDVPAILRGVDQADLVTALAGAAAEDDKAAVTFLLANMSTRMADNLREEIGERGKVKLSETEEAMTQIVGAIRALVDEGTISLIEEDSERVTDKRIPACRYKGLFCNACGCGFCLVCLARQIATAGETSLCPSKSRN